MQNIGAYGVELQDRFESLDAVDLVTGRSVTLGAGDLRLRLPRQRLQAFARRPQPDHAGALSPAAAVAAGARLPRAAERKIAETGIAAPDARQIFDWVCAIRRAKLPDPAAIGNAGSFFKNPVVTPEQCRDIIGRDPEIVHYPMPDGSVKLAAGWMIDACGWKGKSVGQAGVYERQALVLVNRGAADRLREVMTLARGDPGKRLRPLRHPPRARAGGGADERSAAADGASLSLLRLALQPRQRRALLGRQQAGLARRSRSFSRVSAMSRLRIVSWPMRSCGEKLDSPFSIVSRSGL